MHECSLAGCMSLLRLRLCWIKVPEKVLLLTNCTVVLVATSWWPDYKCLKKSIQAFCEETISVFDSSFKKQPRSWLQTPQLIPCWLSKLCSLMLFEGPCTTLIIQNFKWPTGFCFSKEQRRPNWYKRSHVDSSLFFKWTVHKVNFFTSCCLIRHCSKWVSIKNTTHELRNTHPHNLLSSCVFLIGLLDSCPQWCQVCNTNPFPIRTDLTMNFKLNQNSFLLTEQQSWNFP